MVGLTNWSLEEFYTGKWKKLPVALAWDKMVNEVWNTNVNTKSDQSGKVSVRGYKGEYEVTIKYKGAVKTVKVQLDENKTLSIEL
jgi:hypothetical protein